MLFRIASEPVIERSRATQEQFAEDAEAVQKLKIFAYSPPPEVTMNLSASLFSFGRPMLALEMLFNPYVHNQDVILRSQPLRVMWTRRAKQILVNRKKPLGVEMQLYFSCLVKKRVLFHDASDLNTIRVNNHLEVSFRAVQATACDPVEFAKNYPVKRELVSNAAKKMHPSVLRIDYRDGQWEGEFTI